jgi:hypothetical protein
MDLAQAGERALMIFGKTGFGEKTLE